MAFDGTYPAVPGNKPVSIIDVTGPTSYVQFVPPATGGQLVSARQFGLNSIEAVWVIGMDSTGAYAPVAMLTPLNKNLGSPNVTLSWQVPGGSQVGAGTNLSTSFVRLYALGTQ